MKLSIIYSIYFLEYVQSFLQRLENGGNMYALAVYCILEVLYLHEPPPHAKKENETKKIPNTINWKSN